MVKRALLIGINYKGSDCPLNGCLNDIDNVAKILTDYEITMLKEEQATRDNILAAIARFVDGIAAGDTLFFQYSGHGSQLPDVSGDERVIGTWRVRGGEIADTNDETIYPYDGKMIVDDELNQLLAAKIPAGAKLFCLFDSCHSATILDLKYEYAAGKKFKADQLETATPIAGEIVCLSGCKDSQTSADAFLDNKASGALTYAFLRNYSAANYGRLMRGINDDLIGQFTQVPVLSSSHLLKQTDKFTL